MTARQIVNNLRELKMPIALATIWLLVWFLVFSETLDSVFNVWMNSNTYTHCAFVVPIAMYFAYQLRHAVLSSVPRPSYIMVLALLALQALWLLGFAADIELFKHAAVFGMLSSVVVLFFGWRIARVLWFPLLFIVFSIPVGEELVPSFQLITADLTVYFLQLSGIAVFRDGLFITIPEGMFEVAEACSGIRFFVACVVMGAIIAYTSYHTVWKRIAFFVFAMILPIIANGLRAYGTILVAHLVDIKYASGADHLVYGWGFFAFVVLLLVAFSRVGAEEAQNVPPTEVLAINPQWLKQRWYPVFFLGTLPLVITFIIANLATEGDAKVSLSTQSQPGETVYLKNNADWFPVMNNPKYEHLGESGEGFDYYIGVYDTNKPGTELISEKNRLFDINKWRYNGDQSLVLSQNGKAAPFRATLLEIGASNGGKRLIIYWYYLPNISSSSSLYIKLYQALNVLSQAGAVGSVIALSLPYESDLESARDRIRFLAEKYAGQLESMVHFE